MNERGSWWLDLSYPGGDHVALEEGESDQHLPTFLARVVEAEAVADGSQVGRGSGDVAARQSSLRIHPRQERDCAERRTGRHPRVDQSLVAMVPSQRHRWSQNRERERDRAEFLVSATSNAVNW